jgi:hypothetical protein
MRWGPRLHEGAWTFNASQRHSRLAVGLASTSVGASLNAGDNLTVRGDTTGERCAAQHREGPPCDFFHRSCLDVQLVVTRRTFVALERPFPWYRMLGHPVSDANHRRAYRTRGRAQNSHSGRRASDLVLITLQRHKGSFIAIQRPCCRVQHYGPIDEKQHHAAPHSRLALVVSARKKGRLRCRKRPKSREETPKEGSDSGSATAFPI